MTWTEEAFVSSGCSRDHALCLQNSLGNYMIWDQQNSLNSSGHIKDNAHRSETFHDLIVSRLGEVFYLQLELLLAAELLCLQSIEALLRQTFPR